MVADNLVSLVEAFSLLATVETRFIASILILGCSLHSAYNINLDTIKFFKLSPHYYILRKGLIEEDEDNQLFKIATIDTEMRSPFVRIVKEEWLDDIGDIYDLLKEFFES